MNRVLKRVLVAVGIVILALLLVVGAYVIYLTAQYSRIEDKVQLTVENRQWAAVETGREYSALSFNIGFGAYDRGFSFFMDTGQMNDGKNVTGKSSRAASKAAVLENTGGMLSYLEKLNPDFILLQEVDVKAHRSWKINQAEMTKEALPGYSTSYASNFHSAYLAYPPLKPHGAVESGLLTLSKYNIEEALRRSFPVDNGFPAKFFDLDRCFSLHRLPVDGQENMLVLINVHMSAYDEGGLIRAAQLDMLSSALEEEAAKGNWVVVGGDYNHALHGSESIFKSEQRLPDWISIFDDSELPDGFSVVKAENLNLVPTCRSADIPYKKGVNYTVVIDGFIVSSNVKAKADNIDLDFAYSDHNPVLLTFSLEAP